MCAGSKWMCWFVLWPLQRLLQAEEGMVVFVCEVLSCDLSPVVLPSVPSAAPRNLTFELLDHRLILSWAALQEEELQGALLAYKVQWTLGGEAQVS